MRLKETKNRVRVEEELEEKFWIERGIRGVPVEPVFFHGFASGLGRGYGERLLERSETEVGESVYVGLRG